MYWAATAKEVTPELRALRKRLVPAGGIWLITAKHEGAISDEDTAMRFVIRRADRR